MKKEDNLKHWEQWATDYGTELRATTKCMSIKRIEIEALVRRLNAHVARPEPVVLEVGCGNGANGFALTSRHPGLHYLGVDFSPSMVENAAKIAERSQYRERMAFAVADARRLARGGLVPVDGVDVVFTDRMLINLSSADEQRGVMLRIAEMLKPGGMFLMIENSVQTHRVLNEVRQALGLPGRPAADYNVFIDEPAVIEPFTQTMTLVDVEDFGSIHDLMLYAVTPSLANGKIEYDTPLMARLSDAVLALSDLGLKTGAFGQNRLWVWRK